MALPSGAKVVITKPAVGGGRHQGVAEPGDIGGGGGGDVGTEFTVGDGQQFIINGLSTNDPTVENAVWSDNGVLVQSGHTAPSGGGGAFPVAEDGFTEIYPVVDGTGGESFGHNVLLRSGNNGGEVTIQTGDDVDGGGVGGVTIKTGSGAGSNMASGNVLLTTGAPGSTSNAGEVRIAPHNASGGDGGDISLLPGASQSAGHRAGRVTVTLPLTSQGSAPGLFVVIGMPTSDPSISDALWSDNGVLVQSGHTAPSGGGVFPLAVDGQTETYPVVDGTGGDSFGHDVLLRSGANGGALYLKSGNDVDGGGVGPVTIQTGDGVTTGSGAINLNTGTSPSGQNAPAITLRAGGAASANGGDIQLFPGQATGAGKHSGRVVVELSPQSGGADQGLLIVNNLPTVDPAVSNALWNDAGTLKISAG